MKSLLVVLVLLVLPVASPASEGGLLFTDSFDGDLSAWDINDDDAIAIVDSGDPEHGGVLRMRPEHSMLRALVRGSEAWPSYRMEGEVLFPTDIHNYLGFIYNLRENDGRVDLGSLYIKGNGSYIRVNARRDWNPSRMLNEEFRTALTGESAIEIGRWQRFALEVEGAECHLYVGDLETPKVTFPYFEHDSGMAGLKPRVVGGPVWVDNLRVTALSGLSWDGPMQPPGIEHRPERLVRDWQVLGPFTGSQSDLERRELPTSAPLTVDGTEHAWAPFATDGRGAVVTGRVVDFLGSDTVAYFATRIEVPVGGAATLEFSSIDDLTMWVNGRFEGYSYADDYAWHDFGSHPDHPSSPYAAMPLVEGANHVLIRVRGGRYASGGFYAAVFAAE